MPNHLVDATSPYLLQHQDNPVDWYEWGDAAFTAAHTTDRPILLSVGYAACHWCHVMAHESFEDPETAAYMNEHFVNVKVDREERPDVDRIYMDAVQAMSGRGGWPMTVFLTPDGGPFFAGTYFPKERVHGLPSFLDVLAGVSDAWQTNRAELDEQADRLTEAVNAALPVADDLPAAADVDRAIDSLAASFDQEHGGFGGAPKFPQVPTLELLLRTAAFGDEAALSMLRDTLNAMGRGGIYDHLGGGFARYSVDRYWLVPHFEKMLYDNALLARTYLRSWQLTGEQLHLDIARATLDYLIRDMTDPSGGIHSAEDADSEGREGAYYVWTWDELGRVLGAGRELAGSIYGATADGNFEGANVLHLPQSIDELAVRLDMDPQELATRRAVIDERLRAFRNTRIRPGRDDKIVTAWNGLALRALAEADTVLGVSAYRDAAIRIAEFLTGPAMPDGRLVRSWRRDRPGGPAYADDYGAAALGLYALYQTTGDERWFLAAERLVSTLVDQFADLEGGGFFATASDAEQLIARPKNLQDNPTPSDNALAAEALLTHSAYTGDVAALRLVEATVRAAGVLIERHPAFAGQMLAVWATALHGIKEVAIVGTSPGDTEALAAVVAERFRPDCVPAVGTTGATQVPLLRDRAAGEGALAYVCRDFVCERPVATPAALRAGLDDG
jgi:uncharacterized protein YyaL (SSP411 family)